MTRLCDERRKKRREFCENLSSLSLLPPFLILRKTFFFLRGHPFPFLWGQQARERKSGREERKEEGGEWGEQCSFWGLKWVRKLSHQPSREAREKERVACPSLSSFFSPFVSGRSLLLFSAPEGRRRRKGRLEKGGYLSYNFIDSESILN